MDESLVGIISDWISQNKNYVLISPNSEVTQEFKKNLGLGEEYKALFLGGFNNKVLLTYKSDAKCGDIFAIDKSLHETLFYHNYRNHIINKDDKHGIIEINFEIIETFEHPVQIALISLAKPEIYTFPRFALGISDIANALRNQFLSEVSLFDLQLTEVENVLEKITEKNFDVIGISMTFGLFDVMVDLVEKLQRFAPNSKITVGGSLAALEYTEILNIFPDIIVSLGRGEHCLPRLVNWFRGGQNIDSIFDIAYVNESGSLNVTSHEDVCNNELSLPELDLLIPTIRAKGVFQLETSRGCYNACSFCPRRHKGNWRTTVSEKSLKSFLDLYCLALLSNGIRVEENSIYIVDEEFIGGNTPLHRERAENICKLFSNIGVQFETSFRMSAVFVKNVSVHELGEKIINMEKIQHYGLRRVLIGVESGVDSVLLRFNKNVSAEENIQGIRLLTALGIPVRFTYITFDPLMTFDELVETFLFQGRTDLIMKKIGLEKSLNISIHNYDDKVWKKLSANVPFYHFVSYMLVSLECLIGSGYYNELKKEGLLTEKTITSLGKKSAIYLDWRIGMISKFSQFWIDRNFSLDYTLKSLAKIYPVNKSNEIRSLRVHLKENAYFLLGKMIYVMNRNECTINSQPYDERVFIKELVLSIKTEQTNAEIEKLFYTLLDFQIDVLSREIDIVSERLRQILKNEDFALFTDYLNAWKNNKGWKLLNLE